MGTAGRSGMQPEDIGALRQAGDPRVSPDGSLIAFVVTDVDLHSNDYKSRVWLAPTDGSEAPRPFTAGPYDAVPRWSPDGRRLAFAAEPPEDLAQICLLPVAHGGERVTVATWPAGITELAWSPDGARLAFVARDPDPGRYGPPGEQRKARDMPPRRITRFFSRLDNRGWIVDSPSRIMVVTADGSSPPKRLTEGPFQAHDLCWSPDGARIAFSSARHDTWDLDGAVDLWTIASDGTEAAEKVTETVAQYAAPAWSPDGSALAYLRVATPLDEPRHGQVGVLDLDTGHHRELSAALDRQCAPYGSARPPIWIGDRLLFSVEDSGNAHVYSVAADGDGSPEILAGGERWIGDWDYAGGTLAMAVSTPATFPEIVVRPAGETGAGATGAGESGPSENRPGETGAGATGAPGGESNERRLTDLTGAFAARVQLGVPEPFTARSADGTEIPCWAIPPVGAEPGRRYPTVLNVHGGPFTSYGNKFFDEFQVQVGSGLGVLYCNPRGSSGYTEAWGRAVRWPECATDPGSGWGGVDFDDVMACVEDGARRFGWVDSDRLAITGGSYGGYMTSWAIGHTKRFKAACSERACNNLMTLEHNSDIASAFRAYVGSTHLQDPDAYMRQSPITYVEDMTTPVLIMHSEEDLRCPISQAEELFVALRLLGREPELVRFPGESHELSRSGAPRHRVERMEIIVGWFWGRLGAA